MSHKPRLGVAMIGYGFMGAAHSQGWRVAPRFFDLEADPVMQVVVGRNEDAVTAAAEKWGWAEHATDWREVIARDDIDIVDIVTPGDSHAEIAIAALEAGKHVLCEKPLANTVEQAEAMAAAADAARAKGVFAMLGHTYRRVPAATFARDLVRAGKVGEIHQVRAELSPGLAGRPGGADQLAPAEGPRRLRRARRHRRAHHRPHPVHHRPEARDRFGPHRDDHPGAARARVARGIAGKAGTELGEVTVDDAALFIGRFESGVLGIFEATRFATGRKNALRVEVSGPRARSRSTSRT